LVRGGNEDDYLLAMAPTGGPGFLVAIADGMGGVAGGAEASRTALRALGAALLDSRGEGDSEQRMLDSFRAAHERVIESAQTVHALHGMGTTLTALWLDPGAAVLGHVGDSRLYLVRDDVCQPLTTDHSLHEGNVMLTRCIGGGQRECQADSDSLELVPGDRYVLCTDGVWNVVAPEVFAEMAATEDAQVAAELLVKRALDAGGPDNATAVLVDVIDASMGVAGPAAASGDQEEPSGPQGSQPEMRAAEEVELPRHERPDARALWPRPASLRAPVWCWLLLAGALALLVYSGLQWAGFDGAVWFGQ